MQRNQRIHQRRQILVAVVFLIGAGLMAAIWCSTWIASLNHINAADWPAFCARR